MPNNIWGDWLEAEPRAGYFGALANRQFTPAQTSYWGGQFGNVYNRFLGQLGQTAMRGQMPTQTFGGFTGQYPWQQQWGELSRRQRGYRESAFSPSMRWLLY